MASGESDPASAEPSRSVHVNIREQDLDRQQLFPKLSRLAAEMPDGANYRVGRSEAISLHL